MTSLASRTKIVSCVRSRSAACSRNTASARARRDLRVQVIVALGQVGRSLLNPELERIARPPEGLLHALTSGAQPSDEQGGEGGPRHPQREAQGARERDT